MVSGSHLRGAGQFRLHLRTEKRKTVQENLSREFTRTVVRTTSFPGGGKMRDPGNEVVVRKVPFESDF